MNAEIAAALIGPVVTALLAIVGVTSREASRRRSQHNRRVLTLTTAREQVDFVCAWLTAHEKADPSTDHSSRRDIAQRDLDVAHAAMAWAVSSELSAPESKTLRHLARSIMLLGVQRRLAQVIRAVYYLVSVVSALVVVLVFAAMTEATGSLGVMVAFTTIMTFLIFLPSIALWLLARGVDRRQTAGGSRTTSPASAVAHPTAPFSADMSNTAPWSA